MCGNRSREKVDSRNFRTDLYAPQWSYLAALDRGWIPKGNLNDDMINQACHREDSGEFKCVLKKGQLDSNIQGALGYVFNVQNLTDPESKAMLKLKGPDLYDAASQVISDFFEKYRRTGVTCDFGGIAMLIEQNTTLLDEGYDDDIYYTVVHEGPEIWKLVIAGIAIAVVAGVAGFVAAMRYNPGFNRRVRSTALFMPLTRSHNSLIRSSLALPALGDEYEELVKGEDDDGMRRSHSAGSAPVSF